MTLQAHELPLIIEVTAPPLAPELGAVAVGYEFIVTDVEPERVFLSDGDGKNADNGQSDKRQGTAKQGTGGNGKESSGNQNGKGGSKPVDNR